MNQILFLGTGPSEGIKKKGKTGRMESSALLETEKGNILIDLTNDFPIQGKKIKKINAILITHGHSDAIGGIPFFCHSEFISESKILKQVQDDRTKNTLTFFAHPKTIEIIKRKFKNLESFYFQKIFPYKTFKIFNINITPFPVKHSLQKGFPTFGFYFQFPKTSFIYASDVGSFDKKAERLMQKADILILDGAMWKQKMIAHLDITEILPKICRWKNKKIIFTHIGKTAPDYKKLKLEIKKICPKALPAFDNMVLKFS